MHVSSRSLIVGVLTMFVGYWLCMALVGISISLGALWLGVVVYVFAPLMVASVGFLGALFARANPLVNGALAGLAGAFVLLAFLTAIVPGGFSLAYLGPALIAVALAYVGSLVAVYVWPRQGF
jgi:hypothetical protein